MLVPDLSSQLQQHGIRFRLWEPGAAAAVLHRRGRRNSSDGTQPEGCRDGDVACPMRPEC